MDDCRAAELVTGALAAICGSASDGESQLETVHVSSLEVGFRYSYGKFQSALPEFEKINRAAYRGAVRCVPRQPSPHSLAASPSGTARGADRGYRRVPASARKTSLEAMGTAIRCWAANHRLLGASQSNCHDPRSRLGRAPDRHLQLDGEGGVNLLRRFRRPRRRTGLEIGLQRSDDRNRAFHGDCRIGHEDRP